MSFSVVTPSLRQFEWLKLASRSVADQGVSLEHIVQDGGTGPEVEAWASTFGGVRLFVEADAGMYDALNRGFARASGEIWGWLNCDEQYLPGALAAVEAEFAADPELDVLLADNLVVDREGRYVAHRYSLRPSAAQLWVRFPVSSCALFFRARVWQPFDSRWKSAADWWWFRDLIGRGARVRVLRRFVAAFTETDENLGLSAVTKAEQAEILGQRPWWARVFKPALLFQHRWRMWRSGVYGVRPFDYAVYTRGSVGRVEFRAERPTGRWIRRGG